MPERTESAGFRAAAFAVVLFALAGFAFLLSPLPASAAQISIVNGNTTSISKWPWQVAIADSQGRGTRKSPRARFFCGGSLITPNLVVTAGHCVADLKPRALRKLEVITGRTRLNRENTGAVTGVSKALMPVNSKGKRRYATHNGGARWDVALLRLDSPVSGPTIKIAGDDEARSWAPGQLVSTTGWGVTGSNNRKASSVLRVANQVMLADQVCRRYNGNDYDPRTMNCLGGPAIHSSTCFGDSGGPLVAPLGSEYRLVGLTSFGDPYCSPYLPSVDSRIAADPMRGWVRSTALRISGIDVVGSGGTIAPARTWCRIPDLDGLTLKRAKAAIRARGCSVARVHRAFGYFPGSRGRIVGASFVAGWLAPVGTGVKLWVGR